MFKIRRNHHKPFSHPSSLLTLWQTEIQPSPRFPILDLQIRVLTLNESWSISLAKVRNAPVFNLSSTYRLGSMHLLFRLSLTLVKNLQISVWSPTSSEETYTSNLINLVRIIKLTDVANSAEQLQKLVKIWFRLGYFSSFSETFSKFEFCSQPPESPRRSSMKCFDFWAWQSKMGRNLNLFQNRLKGCWDTPLS